MAMSPLLAIIVLGAYSQVAQALLIREELVVFDGNEVSLGSFYASWLLLWRCPTCGEPIPGVW